MGVRRRLHGGGIQGTEQDLEKCQMGVHTCSAVYQGLEEGGASRHHTQHLLPASTEVYSIPVPSLPTFSYNNK